RLWDRVDSRERRIYPHPVAVTSVACSPAGAKQNLCVSGCMDGSIRIFDLSKDSKEPIKTIPGSRRGSVNCIAFSPDGTTFATGSDDRDIALWDTASGQLKYHMPGHSGAVTSVSYTPSAQLVSAGRDKTLRVWSLGDEGGRLENVISKRSGDVPHLGIS